MFGDPVLSKSGAFAELRNRGAAKAIVAFQGGNDEGGVEEITLLDADGKEVGKLQEYYGGSTWNPETKKWDKPKLNPQVQKDADLAEALGKPVYDKYYNFAGEFYVQGTVIWDVKTQDVKMSGSESHEEWDEFEEDY
jgi:hypothetical protein